MKYRPPDYENPYKDWIEDRDAFICNGAYELGYSDAGEHILSLLKEKAPSSVVVDILEMRKEEL